MASNLRVLGYNLQKMAETKGLDDTKIASVCGLSLSDVYRAFEGRLVLSNKQVNELSKVLGCGIEELTIKPQTLHSYGECMGVFSNPSNEDIILNIIDDYIDILSVV